MGKEKGANSRCEDCKEEKRDHCCREKETFAANESTVGGEEKSTRKEVNPAQQVFSQPVGRSAWSGCYGSYRRRYSAFSH